MPKPKLRCRDWLFGAGGKRRLLEALLSGKGRAWSEAELARVAGLHAKGSVDVHLAALVQLGLLTRHHDGYRLMREHPLVKPLRRVLDVVALLEDVELARPPASGEVQRSTHETR